MLYEVEGTQTSTGKKVKARVEANTPEAAVARATRHGVVPIPGTQAVVVEAKPQANGVAGPTAATNGHVSTVQPALRPRLATAGREPLASAPSEDDSRVRMSGPMIALIALGSAIVGAILIGVPLVFLNSSGKSSSAASSSPSTETLMTESVEVPQPMHTAAAPSAAELQAARERAERAKEEERLAVIASATKNAWSAIYRADTEALSQIKSDELAAMKSVISGYQFDARNVDRELLAFVDDHVSKAGAFAGARQEYQRKLDEVDEDAERSLQKMIDTIFRPACIFADDQDDCLRNAIAGARLGMQFDIKNAKDKVHAEYKPKYEAAWDDFAKSLKQKKQVADALATRYGFDFPVGMTINE